MESPDLVEQVLDFLAGLHRQAPASADVDELPLLPRRSAEELKARFEQSLRESANGEGISHEDITAHFARQVNK